MLLFAVLETWIVTIWQPDLGRRDLEEAVARFFAFPYTVTFTGAWHLMQSGWLIIDIRFGPFQLFFFVSPLVNWYSVEWVFWFAQIRMLAFRIIFSFHLIALLLLLLILASVDVTYRLFQIRVVTKNPKGDLEGFSRSFEEGRTRWSDSSTSHRERSFSIEALKSEGSLEV